MDKIQTFLDNVVEIFFVRAFSFFEIFSLLFVSHLAVTQNSLWWLILYLPIIIISTLVQMRYETNK